MDTESAVEWRELSAGEKDQILAKIVERFLEQNNLEIRLAIWNEGTYRTVSLQEIDT